MIKNMEPEALQYVLILEQGAEVAQNQAINAHISLRVLLLNSKMNTSTCLSSSS